MKNNLKTETTKKNVGFTEALEHKIDTPLMNGDLLTIPVGVLGILCVFFLATYPSNTNLTLRIVTTLDILLPSLALIAFGTLYLHKTIRRQSRSLPTRVVSSVLALLLFLAVLATLLLTRGDTTCPGMIGAGTNCIGAQYSVLSFTLFNSLVLPILGILSIAGIISIFISSRNQKK